MPATVPALSVVVTKVSASGNFQFLVQTPQGAIKFPFALLSADMATAAALTSGNSATFNYTQDGAAIAGGVGPTHNDFPNSLVWETF